MNQSVIVRGLSAALPFGGSRDENLQILRHPQGNSAEYNLRVTDQQLAEWLNSFAIPAKQKKFFDRASILLFRALEPLRPLLTGLQADETAFFIALGPNRADLDFFLDWSERDQLDSDGAHASLGASDVVRLLPNVSVTNLAVPLGLRGENGVYAGFASAAGAALEAARDGLQSGRFPAAIVAAASSPLNYFNEQSRQSHFSPATFSRPLAEGAAAVVLSLKDGDHHSSQRILKQVSLGPPVSFTRDASALPWDFLTASPLIEWLRQGESAGIVQVQDALSTVTLEFGQ